MKSKITLFLQVLFGIGQIFIYIHYAYLLLESKVQTAAEIHILREELAVVKAQLLVLAENAGQSVAVVPIEFKYYGPMLFFVSLVLFYLVNIYSSSGGSGGALPIPTNSSALDYSELFLTAQNSTSNSTLLKQVLEKTSQAAADNKFRTIGEFGEVPSNIYGPLPIQNLPSEVSAETISKFLEIFPAWF